MRIMKNMMFYAITLFLALLCTSCELNKTRKDIESTLPDQEEESLNQEEETLTLKEQLNLIDYDLYLPQGIIFSCKNGFHFLVPDTTHNEKVNNEDTRYFVERTYNPRCPRFVLIRGEYVMYNPNISVDDLALIGIKEAIIWLSYMKMRYNDPRIRNLDDVYDICSEASYYLLFRDEEVRQDNKKIAEEHYQALCNTYEEQGELKKVLNSSDMRLCFELSQYDKYHRYIIIIFDFDNDGYLKVTSDIVSDEVDVSDYTWLIGFDKSFPLFR